jgi:hypothetical protein
MKRFIVRVFRIAYQITGAKLFSFIFALIYVTGLNLVTIYGLSLLLEGLFPTTFIVNLFSFPYIYVASIAMLGLVFAMAPSFTSISVERKKKPNYATVLIYSVVSLLLFVYSTVYDKI